MIKIVWNENYEKLHRELKDCGLDNIVCKHLETLSIAEILYISNSTVEELGLIAIRKDKQKQGEQNELGKGEQ